MRPAAKLRVFIVFGALSVSAYSQQSASWRDASPHTVRFVTVEESVRLEVLDWGGTGRSVVLLAGGGNTAHVFDELAPKLATDYQQRAEDERVSDGRPSGSRSK
jgi:sporulation-control protein spo0M